MEDLCVESFQDYLSDENCIERNNLHNDYERFRRQSSSDLYDTDNQTTGIYSQPGRPDFNTTKLDRAVIDRMNSASPALKKGHHHVAAVDICQICEEDKCAYCDVEYDEFHNDDKNDDSRFRMHHRKFPCCRTQKSSSHKSHKPSRTPS
ncbi:unnamed protein product [Dibothriocephalus latus]|uniref:Uncharacterized protein n=1 Tax=Dibothriocephalus latus TaxID=60516 RepID=A0A3P6SSV6_DIBLA|nr:unnamed protein product [Dibothriocephalus latus]